MESACDKTMNGNPLDLPVLGSVFTFIDSISPYFWECSPNSLSVVSQLRPPTNNFLSAYKPGISTLPLYAGASSSPLIQLLHH
jgi:hypothetical protein